jgi:hypothetical protein
LPGPVSAATAANQPVPSTSEAASNDGIRPGSGMPGVATRVPSAIGMRARCACVPIVPMMTACGQKGWYPAWQISQVLSEAKNEPTTKSPALTFLTSLPVSSTTPAYSWPIGVSWTSSTPR